MEKGFYISQEDFTALQQALELGSNEWAGSIINSVWADNMHKKYSPCQGE